MEEHDEAVSSPCAMDMKLRVKRAKAVIAELMEEGMSLLIASRRWRLRVYDEVMVGQEFCEWMVQIGRCQNRQQAVDIADQWIDLDLLHHVADAHEFKDEFLFYRFRLEEDTSGKGPSAAAIATLPTIARSGYLLKKGKLLYSRKWVLIDAGKRMLYIFQNQRSTSPRYTVALTHAEVQSNGMGRARRGTYCMCVADTTRASPVLVLATESAEELHDWAASLVAHGATATDGDVDDDDDTGVNKSVFDFSARSIHGSEMVDLAQFRGCVLLIVNIAADCGLTKTNVTQLQELHERYHSHGLRILAFPSNEFGGQHSGGTAAAISLLQQFGAGFTVMGECRVNGRQALPLFRWLRRYTPTGVLGKPVRWNYSKFLCSSKGKPVARYAPFQSPKSFEEHIERQLFPLPE